MGNYTREILTRIFELNDLLPDLKDVALDIDKAINLITESLSNGNKVMFCGNGGSAADCQHWAAEFQNRFFINRKPYAGISLTTDTSIITSIGNDFDFKEIFSKQVEAIGNKGDILFAITTSGKSKNILEAINVANEMGIHVILLTGNEGSYLKYPEFSSSYNDLHINVCIAVPSDKTPRIQECHILIGHIICEIVEKNLTDGNVWEKVHGR